jgi:flavodoxin
MRAVVVYESMYGNTHLVADAIGAGLRPLGDVAVVPAEQADASMLAGADLVVVGGPTHAHGMSKAETRRTAIDLAEQPGSDLVIDPDAEGPGLRAWFDRLGDATGKAAAFDTRFHYPAMLTGRASKGITRRLDQHGFAVIAEPESFFVTRDTVLEPGEQDRARRWGESLAAAVEAGETAGLEGPN